MIRGQLPFSKWSPRSPRQGPRLSGPAPARRPESRYFYDYFLRRHGLLLRPAALCCAVVRLCLALPPEPDFLPLFFEAQMGILVQAGPKRVIRWSLRLQFLKVGIAIGTEQRGRLSERSIDGGQRNRSIGASRYGDRRVRGSRTTRSASSETRSLCPGSL